MGNFSDESLEGEFSDEEISGFLIFPDFSEGNCSGFESVGFLDTGGDRCALAGDLLGNQLFSGYLLSSGFPCGLFCSGHNRLYIEERAISFEWRFIQCLYKINLIGWLWTNQNLWIEEGKIKINDGCCDRGCKHYHDVVD